MALHLTVAKTKTKTITKTKTKCGYSLGTIRRNVFPSGSAVATGDKIMALCQIWAERHPSQKTTVKTNKQTNKHGNKLIAIRDLVAVWI